MLVQTLLLLLFARLASAAITMPIFRTDFAPKDGPGSVGIGLSAGAGDTEINPKVYDGRTWLTVHVEFGNPSGNEPRRVYNLVLDTGSSDLWVVANGCQSCGWTGPGTPAGYDLSKKQNTTLVPAELGYGALTSTPAHVQGFIVEDAVSLEGHKLSDTFPFTVATSVKGIPIGPMLSGIFPLAPGTSGSLQKKSPISALREAGLIDNEDVGFSANSANPSLTIGGVDETFTSDSSGMVNVTSSNFEYYIVPMDKVSVNGEIVGASTAPVQALLDTGTTFWYGPSDIVKAFYQAIPGGKLEYNDAGSPSGILPEVPQGPTVVSVGIGGKTFTMNYSSLLNTDQPRRPREAGYIYGTLMESTNDTLWILGLSFLENVYVAFNPTWSQVSIWPLSQANGGPLAEQSPPQGAPGDQSTESVIYGYSTITTEVVNSAGARVWSGTETRTTWVPVSTTMVPVGAATTPTPPAESLAPQLSWGPSVVTQTILKADQSATWTETETHTTWVQSPVSPTPAPDAPMQEQQEGTALATTEPANESPPPEQSGLPSVPTETFTKSDQSATWTEVATITGWVPVAAAQTLAPEGLQQEQSVAG